MSSSAISRQAQCRTVDGSEYPHDCWQENPRSVSMVARKPQEPEKTRAYAIHKIHHQHGYVIEHLPSRG